MPKISFVRKTNTFPRCGFAEVEMRADRLDELAADRIQRIQRRQWILEHRADFAAAHFAHRFVRKIVDAPSRQPNFAARNPAGWIDEADYRGAGERFARARFADDAQHLALCNRKADIAHCDERASTRGKLDAQCAHVEQRTGVARVAAGRADARVVNHSASLDHYG